MGCEKVISAGIAKPCGNIGGNHSYVYVQTYAMHSGQTVNGLNVVTAITLSGNSKLQKLETVKYSVTFDDKPSYNEDNETYFFNVTVTLKLAGITTENRNFINEYGNQGLVFYLPRRDSKLWQAGGGYLTDTIIPSGSGLFLTPDSSFSSGAKPEDFAGATLSFAGQDKIAVREVQSSAITANLP